MALVNQIRSNFQQQLALFNRRIVAFFSLMLTRLKNFKALTIQEQIAFGLVGIGLVLILISFMLFLL